MDKRYIAGIDVGTSTIKVFIGTMDMDGSVLIVGSGIMPTAGLEKGSITDVQKLAMSIQQAVACAVLATNISVKDAYLGIGGLELCSISSTGSIAPENTDAITHEDINRVYQAAIVAAVPDDHEVLHMLPKYFLVDKQRQTNIPVLQKCTQLEVEVHIVTMPKKTINALVGALEKLGIGIIGVVASSIVTTQTLATSGLQNYLFVDIGAGTTELILYRDRQIDLSATLPLGGDYITNDIMKGFDVSYIHAEDIKKYYAKLDKNLRGQNIILDCNDYGTTDKQVAYDFLYDIIESRIDEIVYLLNDYLKVTLGEYAIEKVFLTGGCGAMPSFADSMEKGFERPIEVIATKELLHEYANPMNVACYGVLKYAINHMPAMQVMSSPSKESFFSKFKKIFKN